jgi:hypothetical protein
VLFISCGDVPLFTEMKTNRLKVIIKGTLETEDISHFTAMNGQDPKASPIEDTNSVDDLPLTAGTNDILPTTFMLDIAELRLDGKKFANYRQVHEFSLSGDGSSEPFFNGTGIVLRNDDPGEGLYTSVQVYIRKMIFDNAMIYTQSGTSLTYEEPAEVIFHENDRYGFDFNQISVNTYVDNLKENASEILRTFPLEVPIIGGLNYSRKDEETVLEIRFVVKNFIKKYEYDYYNEGIFKVCHYFSFSDWVRDIRAGEKDVGGNLHAVARAYVPGKTAQVTVTAGAGNYVIAIPSTEAIADYGLTDTGINLRNNNVSNCDMPLAPSYPGNYIEAVLDYYLKYEQYKIDWTSAAGSCSSFSTYETEWNNYENSVNNFKIAPYIGYSTGTVVFNNMAPGTYNFYLVNFPSYGALFLSTDFTSSQTNIVVEAGVPQTVTIP